MKRQPSIHVTKEILEKLFDKYDLPKNNIPRLMMDAQQYALLNRRAIAVASVAKAKKIKNIVQVDNKIVGQFALRYREFIKDNKIRKTPAIITSDHSDFKFLKQAVKIYVEYCAEFDLEADVEIDDFLILSYKVMGKKNFTIRKFNYYRTRILDEYNLLLTIQTDVNEKFTINMFNYYLTQVSSMSTMDINDLKTNKVYYHFVLASEDAIAKKSTAKNWVDSQFEALAYLEAIPEPNQMYGKHAQSRYRKWQLKNNKR